MIFSKSSNNASSGVIPHSPPVGLTVEIPQADLAEPLSPILSSSESNSLPFSASTPLVEDHKKARDERLCKLFGLENEEFKDYFLCAYMTKSTPWFVVQGLLYVFERHICFLSSLFGIETRKVIPLQHLESVKKATTLGIPNSITITYKDGSSDFFTSFLSRKPAFTLINEALQTVMYGPKSCEPRKMEVSMFGRKVKRQNVFPRVASTNSMHRVRSQDNVRPSSRPASPCPEDDSAAAGSHEAIPGSRPIRLATHRRSRSGHRRNNSRGGGSRGHSRDWEDDLAAQLMADQQQAQGQVSVVEEGDGEAALQNGSQLQQGSSGEELVMDTPFMSPSAQLRCLDTALSGEIPSPPEGWTLLAEGVVAGGTPEQLAVLLLSDDPETSSIVKFNNIRGHRKVFLDPHGWQEAGPELEGSIRLFEFESKKLGAWTRCVQQQRCRYFPGSTIIFNTEQKMPDLKIALMGKIGDQFSVDCHWEIRPVEGPGEGTGGNGSGLKERSSAPAGGESNGAAAGTGRVPTPSSQSAPLPSSKTASSVSSGAGGKGCFVRVFGQVNFASHASGALPRGKIRSSAISELKEWYTAMLPYLEEQLKEFNPRPRTPLPSPLPSSSQPDTTTTQPDGTTIPSRGAAPSTIPKPKPPRPTTPSRRSPPDPPAGPSKLNLPPLYPAGSLTSPASPSRATPKSSAPAGSGLPWKKSSNLGNPGNSRESVFTASRGLGTEMELERKAGGGTLEWLVGRGQGWMVLLLVLLNLALLSKVWRMEGQLQQLGARLAAGQ